MLQIKGELFEKVQQKYIFPDSKTFVDSYPINNPEEILKKFQQKTKSLPQGMPNLSPIIMKLFNL
ncbi:MAG TPA: hypothetical protein PL110_21620 [Candidatus Eremiobacteraeota bacterium]|nr:hypothetical protein [Candidatus Eremiobacteraeota bacterium]